jgi:hypothetical protein
MKTETTLKSFFVALTFFSTLFLSSCDEDSQKPDAVNDPAKREAVEKVLTLREELNFVNRFVNENVIDASSDGGRESFKAATLSRLKELMPCGEAVEEEQPDGSIRITMNFGAGCETEDGIKVAGAVEMIMSFSETGFEYIIVFTDYSELNGENEGEVVNGTVSGRFIFDLENGTLQQEMDQDLTVLYPDNTEAGYKLSQQAELTEEGLRVTSMSVSGNLADGGVFAISLSKSLVYDFSCNGDFPVEGQETMVFQGNSMVVNYGNGSCDQNYTVQ